MTTRRGLRAFDPRVERAIGDDPLVSNRMGGVPQTIISPSLLFDELEVKRADTSKDKLPEYPAPDLKKK